MPRLKIVLILECASAGEWEAWLAANHATASEALDARNRYAVLYRIHDAKKPETRVRRIEKFVGMLERGERIH